MAHTELDFRERRLIEDMLHARDAVREIAAEIGRHVSTVYREVKRNSVRFDDQPEINGYYGMVAQRTATQRRARRRKLVRLVSLRKAVIKQLIAGWSPEQIAGRLQFEGQRLRVSQTTRPQLSQSLHGALPLQRYEAPSGMAGVWTFDTSLTCPNAKAISFVRSVRSEQSEATDKPNYD